MPRSAPPGGTWGGGSGGRAARRRRLVRGGGVGAGSAGGGAAVRHVGGGVGRPHDDEAHVGSAGLEDQLARVLAVPLGRDARARRERRGFVEEPPLGQRDAGLAHGKKGEILPPEQGDSYFIRSTLAPRAP